MDAAVFIGDELTGAGFRLAGLRVLAPEPERVTETFHGALAQARLLIITDDCAAQLPVAELQQAILRASPPVAVIPAAGDRRSSRALVRDIRVSLGMET